MSASTRINKNAISSQKQIKNLTAVQKKKATEFMQVTGALEKHAINYLAQSNWALEGGIDAYYYNPPAPEPQAEETLSVEAIQELYKTYAIDEGEMGDEGLPKFLQDCGISEASLEEILQIFSWKCKAKKLLILNSEEFLFGMKTLKCDSIQKFSSVAPSLPNLIQDPVAFREFYQFLFDFVREGKSHLDSEVACELWRTWLQSRSSFCSDWILFTSTVDKSPINRDVWNQFLVFASSVLDISKYDPDDAWPLRIDSFVEWLKTRDSSSN